MGYTILLVKKKITTSIIWFVKIAKYLTLYYHTKWKKKDQSIKDYIRTIRCENIKCNGLIFSIQFIKREIVYMKGCEWMYLIVEAKKFSN